MKYRLRIEVNLKSGHSDPEGETTARALQGLGYDVTDIRVGKRLEIIFEAANREEGEAVVEQMCRRVFSNPTKDDYSFEIQEII